MSFDPVSYAIGKAAGGGGGGSVTVEPLYVTENGTFTAPAGKAYSPVTVNTGEEPEIKVIGVKNGGVLTSAPDDGVGHNVSHSYELYVSLDGYADDSFGWFYGGTATQCGIRLSRGGVIDLSTNVGDYSYVSVFGYQKGEKIHVVCVYSYSNTGGSVSITKKVFYNGVIVGEKTADTTSQGVYDHFVNLSNFDISVYHKRIWTRALSAQEIEALYNNGNPEDFILTTELLNGLESNLSPDNLSESGWLDSVTQSTITLAEGAEILTSGGTPTPSTGVIDRILYPDFAFYPDEERMPHDCTFIGDDYVTFNQPSDGGVVDYINPETWEREARIRVMFTEANGKYLQNKSVDYKFNKLIIGNGRAIASDESSYTDQGARLYVFHATNTWKTLTANITFENCGDYDVIDVSEIGYKVYGFWGGAEDLVFVSCNLFNDVFLIRLGRGTNQLQLGTYTASSSTRYNGTYDVLNHWHQQDGLGSYSAHGGQYYNGYLYLATNDQSLCTVYRCNLSGNGVLSFDQLNFDQYGEGQNPSLICRYIDGMCVHNGVMYAQPLIGENGQYLNYVGVIKADVRDLFFADGSGQ